jgi:glycogen debranching enzyme
MDAAPNGNPVTPRNGKAVEIQALWYNALKTMELLANHYGQGNEAETYLRMAEKAKKSFLEKFWNPQKSCFFDVVTGDNSKDDSLRPNQILAASLDFSMPDSIVAQKAVETVEKQLLTPYGLKTLVSGDPRYASRIQGNRWQRDQAYHNGTVWPWLLGPYVTAFLKLKNHESQWRSYAFENFLKPLLTGELNRACLGSISEVADGDPPHEPGGCISQAWSVAEPLRAYVEDVLLERPPYEGKVLGSQKT